MYVNASTSWLYGKFDIRIHEFEESADAVDFSKIRRRPNASLAVADAGLGIRWEKCFWENKRLLLQVGLEHHCYFDYNRLGAYGDLSFDGVNFSAGIEF